MTTTSSFASVQSALWVLVFGELPLYTATQWWVPAAVGVNCGFGVAQTRP